jgi:hypothetical protein
MSPANDPGFRAFADRARAYQELHDRAARGAPKLAKDSRPEQIDEHRRQLADRIRRERAGARAGDVFDGSLDRFLQVIHASMQGPGSAPARRTVEREDSEREEKVEIKVNADYPEKAPLSTVPPELLDQLPPLPKSLQYRFVGSDLILLDPEAMLIVDYIERAIP